MRTVLIAIGIIFCLSCSAYSQAGKAKALPQSPASSTIKGKDQKQILGYVRGLTETPGEIDEKIERLLMKAVPKEYAQGCKSLVGTWGKKAAKSSAMLLRPLYLHQEPGHVGQLLLSLTCYSTLPEFGNAYYDERLALLTVDEASSKLQIVPHSRPCAECSELTHIGTPEAVQVGGTKGISVEIFTTTKNPCCPQADSAKKLSVYYYLFTPAGVQNVTTILKRQDELFHQPAGNDSVVTYDATLYPQKDPAGSIKSISVSYTLTINRKLTKQGAITYQWNQKRGAFDSTQ